MTNKEAIVILDHIYPKDVQRDIKSQEELQKAYEIGMALTMAINALEAQKTGKWQKYEGRFDYDWECSECGCSSYEKTDWCAHCGAFMGGAG